jgi:predicted TIM-barrel fold metal-dependent hydrolase
MGTVHPDLSVDENMTSLKDNGIVGVKLHPLFQALSYADPRVHDILAALADEGMPVITHVGAGETPEANERGAPALVRQVIDSLPHLKLIACHYGGYHRLDEAEQYIVGSPVTLETSWPPTLAELEPERLVAIISRHGADRVVFGSDWPMADPAAEIAAVRALGLDPESEQAILGGNLARLLGLTQRAGEG